MRISSLSAITVLAYGAAATAAGGDMPERLPAAEAYADIELARTTLENIHPGYDRYTERAELDALWAALEA